MKSVVTLPINHGILLPVIKFLYTDCCPEVENSDSIDFICSLLVVADQLFITRLREICEMALANLITLRNCAELCQFAHTYNATQLKQCCMEFISLNIYSFLENRSLEILEEDLLEDITKYYCKFNPIMSSRIITPFYNAPDDDVVNELHKLYAVNLDSIDDEFKADPVTPESTKKKNKPKKLDYTENEKARMRYESVSSVNSIDMSNDSAGDITLSLSKLSTEPEKVEKDKWIKVPTAQQKQQKLVQARLKAINSAKDIQQQPQVESFVKLSKNNSISDVDTTTAWMSVSPKETPLFDFTRSVQGSLIINQGPKLSQKQRKKLAQQNYASAQSLENNMSNNDIVESPPTPKNPWKLVEVPVASSSHVRPKILEFNQILADQKKQKDDSSRIMTKPLNLTQVIILQNFIMYKCCIKIMTIV